MSDDPDRDARNLDALLSDAQAARSQTSEVRQSASEDLDRVEQRSGRLLIMRTVLWTYAACILCIALMSLGGLFVEGTRQAIWKDGVQTLATMANTLVLPVVTLVLGYYFGRGAQR